MRQINYWQLIIALISAVSVFVNTSTAAINPYKQQVAQFYGLANTQQFTLIKIPAFQQTTEYTCGPAIAMTVLHYFGKLSDNQLNAEKELAIAREMGTTESAGTSEQQLATWFNHHGFEAQVGYNGTIALLKHNLANGIITLVDWIDWGGHWVAVAGYNQVGASPSDNKDTLFFADPAVSTDNIKYVDGLSSINPARFAAMWLNSKLVKGIYITVKPVQHGYSLRHSPNLPSDWLLNNTNHNE